MPTQGESLIKKTQKGLSILAFETTKQSRILKKRMRIAALQKETKADLRDLGNLVYNSIINEQPGILEEEEVKILVENIRVNKAEVERLRDAIARLSRAKKHFVEEEFEETPAQYAPPPPATEEQPIAEEPPLEPTLEPTAELKPGEETGAEGELEEQPAEPTPAPQPPEPEQVVVSPAASAAEEEPEEEPAEKPPAPPGPGADPDQPEATSTEPEKKEE
jgi:hypothetical protein